MPFAVKNPFVLPLVVQTSDVDVQERASNEAILAWMNQAAVAHSDAEGYDHAAYERLGALFVVRRHEIDYFAPARLGDRLLCATWPSERKRASAHRRYEIVREDDFAFIAKGLTRWAFLDLKTQRPKRQPPEILAAFDPARFL
jgi:acyl-CoA thioester hydrolase